MNDVELIELLFARDENALKIIDRQYGNLCKAMATNILGNESDAEECVSDAYLAVWNSIPPQRPASLRSFLLRILRNRCVTRYHANTAQKRNSFYDVALDELADVLPDRQGQEESDRTEELAKALNDFLHKLSESDRAMFLRRYWQSESVASLATAFGKQEHYISVRLFRLRERLRKFLHKRGISV